jgi:phosphopantothenoylcysteine decarboxylase/phosphopantothenate--cysteine ligase
VTLVGPSEIAEIEGTKDAIADAILDWAVPILDQRRPR